MATKTTGSPLEWTVPLEDGPHIIQFEHGTTSGRRVLTVDGKEVFRKNWMFKLVGHNHFKVGKDGRHKGSVLIAVSGMVYTYTLFIDGKMLDKHAERHRKANQTWSFKLGADDHIVALDKETMSIWADGDQVDATGEFVDDGTETHFEVDGHPCFVFTSTTGDSTRDKIAHSLYVDELEVDVSEEDRFVKSDVGYIGGLGGDSAK